MAASSRSSLSWLAFCLFTLVALIVCPGTEAGSGNEIVGWLTSKSGGSCDGTIAECLGTELEFDSESNRRILATSDYISYQALSADSTPSCGAGNSYYNNNCQGQANPYNRPCSKQAGCRG